VFVKNEFKKIACDIQTHLWQIPSSYESEWINRQYGSLDGDVKACLKVANEAKADLNSE